MKYFLAATLVLATALVFTQGVCAQDDPAELLRESAKVFDEVNQMPEKGISGIILKNCTGVAIFPDTFNFALGVGGRKGEGVIVHRNPTTGKWSNPAFFDLSGTSLGLQAGGQKIDLVLMIRSEEAFAGMLENKYNVGNKSSLTIGPIGRNAESGVLLDTDESGGIYTYSRTKGLFAGSALKGIKVKENKGAILNYYGTPLSVQDILYQNKGELEDAGQNLISVLEKYTAK
ncbi:MAG: lipid-binding SYLF domain-containing protein [Candidatus Omnitrophica bacterium]|nr:lipid-binding SYLF domain-containing protein [Candidatus Omnitrophota bacterium]